MDELVNKTTRNERKKSEKAKILQREYQRNIFKMITDILKKNNEDRTEKDLATLQQHKDVVQVISERQIRRMSLKRKNEELFDDADVLQRKVKCLAEAIRSSPNVVIYTGAGISTAASIPDYRGPNGVWTQLKRGLAVRLTDLSQAEPTFTHMSIAILEKEHLVKHIVSQNCDGLHLRSGLSRSHLSELHGNMFIEVCASCKPAREFIRLFDVTERTSLRKHDTGRICRQCGAELRDTIVHFGERGTLEQPLNWKGAIDAAKCADTILCLGSSLKVLKKYPSLWCMNRPVNKRPKLYIVNLQWTPKDNLATLKIHGKCDDVMSLLMAELNIKVPSYNRADDPIFNLATKLEPSEECSHTRSVLTPQATVDVAEGMTSSAEVGDNVGEATIQGGWFGRGYNKGRK